MSKAKYNPENADSSEDRTVLRERARDQIIVLRNTAIAELERRGYEVRGKTTSQIRKILRRRPTKLPFTA
jgi:hypothetical protein